ncbi:hypothetical protein EDC96DRAFT_510921 [Choanephora cucurbitarum]|nr:hypothetical protein EDC96DRAFT_510921 [Choanephora cucurbitarum]
MVETKKISQEDSSEYTVIYIENPDTQNITYKAIGTYKDQEEAYAAAIVNQLQVIEHVSKSWPKAILIDKQDHILELCQKLKQDFTTYQERFIFLTAQCSHLFQDLLHGQHHVLISNRANKPQIINESIFKTKLRNFLDAFQTRTDIEEDLDNSDEDDDEDEEDDSDGEEEDLGEEEESEDGEELEEDIPEEEEEEEEGHNEDSMEEDLIEEEEEERSNTNVVPETTEDELDEEEGSGLKREASTLDEEDDEEDEIEEDNDEDELEEEDNSNKRRRTTS